MTNKTTKMFVGMLALGMLLLLSFASAGSSLIYNDSTYYTPSSHTYGIPASYLDYVTVLTKGMSGDEVVCAKFIYTDGSNGDAPCQKLPYKSWTTNTFANPNPNMKVSSVTIAGGTNTYMQAFNAYGGISYTETETVKTFTNTTCGNNVKEEAEQCDNGESNGVSCVAGYGSSCNYCSSSCTTKIVKGEYCGDGILNIQYERCDDGNRIDNDRCTNECKKPFEVVVEDFVPSVWQCADSRIVYDDATEPGRISEDGKPLAERINNYAFEGEQIQWKVLVMDKNGIEKVRDVYATVNENMEANCMLLHDNYFPNQEEITETVVTDSVTDGLRIDPSCNARIDEEVITEFNPQTMAYYLCTLTVETPDSMYGQSDVNVEVEDMDGQLGNMAEKETWFFNPLIQLTVDGEIMFENARPGTSSYSGLVVVGNDADIGSGVTLDMFISGTDFYDSSNSGAKCGTTNQLELNQFTYHATKGAYSSYNDIENGRTCDSEGYCHINYGIGFNDPKPFYNRNEIIQAQKVGPYYTANTLSPGSEMSLIFRVDLPEPCNGDFDSGNIYFWGEAI